MNRNDSLLPALAGQRGALQIAADLPTGLPPDLPTNLPANASVASASAYGVRDKHALLSFGAGRIDRALHGGLPMGALHEIQAAAPADYTNAAAFCLLLGERCMAGAQELAGKRKTRFGARHILWISGGQQGQQGWGSKLLYAPGLAELGIEPDHIIYAQAADDLAALRVAGDAVRSRSIAAVILNLPGRKPAGLDLTATRRFSLFARESGTTMFLLRSDIGAASNMAGSTAAYSRWSLASAASRALATNAPGHPAFDIELLRHRRGIEGLTARLEWKREARIFTEYTPDTGVVPAPALTREDIARAWQRKQEKERLRA